MPNPAVAYLTQIAQLSPGLIDFIESRIKTKHYPKKTLVQKAGQISENIYFVESGILRCFYKKDDREISNWFMSEGDVIISVKSFYQRIPSLEYIEALENSELHYLNYTDLQHIYYNFPEFNLIGRILTEQYYILSEERNYTMRFNTAAERFKILKKSYPKIVNRVQAKYIASYLGITEETLSRIKID
ncbi:MAG: cyclic nucleotide-binding domain-containing protein [Sediminibacterium sp.]|uniref:Crp/Fnr family transcriptional regulator n=1 Tax=Sediminibacterium sp. TaxID=1917865 RepID=UPI002721C738|nr:cyclic nucleotide-binding domain-containing protein [Sediminibacterium sp.]MDO8998077.1 cyclic nucleotide-binding domain-containing protein [Sediminibacterium sp.]